MNAAPARIGLLGDWLDPATQLMEAAFPYPEHVLVPLDTVTAEENRTDRILVTSQDLALAHFSGLKALDRPVAIVLRRPSDPAEHMAWERGLAWLDAAVETCGARDITFHTLTPDACADLEPRVKRPVTPLPPLTGTAPPDAPILPIDRGEPVATFTMSTPDGARETRRMHWDRCSWIRLRRRARLTATDAADADMDDLVKFANGTETPRAQMRGDGPICILAVVPNGIGLGHVTRMMAVGMALQRTCNARVIFWSFSRAAEIISAAGFEVILRQTAVHLDAHPPDWRRWETLEFAAALRAFRPQVITYDGGTMDPFMIDALGQAGCGRCGVAWVRRGMFQPDADAQLLETEEFCDLVLEPGDMASARDEGPTRTRQAQFRGFSRKVMAGPVTLKPFLAPHTRRQAKQRLGLGWGRHCLVSLGGAFGAWDTLRGLLEEHARVNKVRLIWAKSPLAPAPSALSRRTAVRQIYPLGRYLAAFDGVVTATGYNSYHELMLGYDRPVLLAPTNQGRIDDQIARAEHAASEGWAEVYRADRAEDQSHAVAGFMRAVRAGSANTKRPAEGYGADTMARAIADLALDIETGGAQDG